MNNRCSYCNNIVLEYQEYEEIDGLCIECLNQMILYEIIQ